MFFLPTNLVAIFSSNRKLVKKTNFVLLLYVVQIFNEPTLNDSLFKVSFNN